jgi:hypothetical protein
MLLALFLIDLAAGLYLFLPLVGRRNAGVKFYRLILITTGVLALCSQLPHRIRPWESAAVLLTIVVYVTLRYPKRLVFRIPAALLGVVYLIAPVIAWCEAMHTSMVWSIVGALSSVVLLGSVTMAMLLGHWYLVVRGMAIDPLKRLTIATLVATIIKIAIVTIAIIAGGAWYEVAIRQGIFFWMRAGWGLVGPLLLYPMVWGTVKIRSTMAATGILYVDVVAVVIGEVLGAWLSAIAHLPV